MWRLLSRVRYSVTEESRLQSILAISVVSTKNASLRSQSHFDHEEATIRQLHSYVHLINSLNIYKCADDNQCAKKSLSLDRIPTQRRSVVSRRMVASHHCPFEQIRKPNVRTYGSSRTKYDSYINDKIQCRVKLTCLTTV